MSPSSEFVPTSQEESDYSEQAAAYELYEKYRWGDEEHGIFIDCQRAKEYYEQAGDFPYKEEWDDSDDPGQEWLEKPREFDPRGQATMTPAGKNTLTPYGKIKMTPENDCFSGAFL